VVLAVGGSAGSVPPLVEMVRALPPDLPAAVLVTIHIGEQTRLPQILSRSGPLPATQVRVREVLEHGRIYIAPPGRHLIRTSTGNLPARSKMRGSALAPEAGTCSTPPRSSQAGWVRARVRRHQALYATG
jgi:chemotaxis response regulator CheB